MPRPGEQQEGGEKPPGREEESSEGTQGRLEQQEWLLQSGIGGTLGIALYNNKGGVLVILTLYTTDRYI